MCVRWYFPLESHNKNGRYSFAQWSLRKHADYWSKKIKFVELGYWFYARSEPSPGNALFLQKIVKLVSFNRNATVDSFKFAQIFHPMRLPQLISMVLKNLFFQENISFQKFWNIFFLIVEMCMVELEIFQWGTSVLV